MNAYRQFRTADWVLNCNTTPPTSVATVPVTTPTVATVEHSVDRATTARQVAVITPLNHKARPFNEEDAIRIADFDVLRQIIPSVIIKNWLVIGQNAKEFLFFKFNSLFIN